nr:MAG TPA: hypothetical protein [Caudoviricetes sp.]
MTFRQKSPVAYGCIVASRNTRGFSFYFLLLFYSYFVPLRLILTENY